MYLAAESADSKELTVQKLFPKALIENVEHSLGRSNSTNSSNDLGERISMLAANDKMLALQDVVIFLTKNYVALKELTRFYLP